MHDYKLLSLLAIFTLFSVGAGIVIIKPLPRKSKLLSAGFAILLTGSVGVLYSLWGGFNELNAYQTAQRSKQQALTLLKDIKSPAELISKLENHLVKNPDSARGWYLLGRVYASQNMQKEAASSFAKAYRLDTNDDAIIVNYAQSLIESGEKNGVDILEKLLVKKPQQPDALALLAMDAYNQGKPQVAAQYWQRLLDTLPANSPEADDLRKVIAKVYQDNKKV